MKMLSVLFSLVFVGSALAQSGTAGNPNFDRANDWRSGMPNVLTIDSEDVAFDGGSVEVPFTLNGGPAEVHLAVYSQDANPQYDGAAFGEGGVGNAMLRAAGLDTLISISGGQTFSEGANSITWDGRDFNGNEVGAGTYTYYLFGLDNISNPTWIGPGSSHSYWMTNRVDFNVDPPVVWTSNQGTEWEIRRGELGLDYFQNPEAYESFLIPWMNERHGQEIQYWDVSSYQPDPADPNVAYITNNAQFDVARGSGVWRVKFDPDNGTILPDEDWAAADRGYVHINARVASSAVSQASHHSWVADDGMIYLANRDVEEPLVPAVISVDRATGEIANILDLSEIYLHETGSQGPWGVDVDDRGIYVSGLWYNPISLPAHVTLAGDLIWLNRNGDGFLDRYFGEEATARGFAEDGLDHQMAVTHANVGRHHIAFFSGFNQPFWGTVLGPDGHGLFNVNLPKMPTGLASDLYWVSDGGSYDGLYAPTGQQELVHFPFDVSTGVIGGDAATAVAELTGASLPSDYALGDNYPNPFNAETAIRFAIPAAGVVVLDIYNISGQLVARLMDGELQAGSYEIKWDGRDAEGESVGSGVYLYELRAGSFADSKQMLLLK